jgi:hypothetical protein
MEMSRQRQVHFYTNLPQIVVKNAGTGSDAIAGIGNVDKIDDSRCRNNP